MAERRGIALLCGVILIAGIVWVWLYYGESQNQLIYAIALIIILIGVAYGRYMGGKKILIATALQRSNSEQLRDIRRDPPRLILAEQLGS